MESTPGHMAPSAGLPNEIRAVNVGLKLFGDPIRAQGAEAVDVDWRIPAGGREDAVAALTRLYGEASAKIDTANREVVRRLDEGAPVLREIGTVAGHVPRVGDRTILHSGPPLAWQDFCDPLRRSVCAAVMAEGWADSLEEAEHLVADGDAELEPADHHAAAVPMATALGPSAPVLIVENPQGGNLAFSGINQGPGATPWFGVDSPEAVERLVFLRDAVAPVLSVAMRETDAIDIFSLVAQGLQMGDDAHMRTQGATNLLLRNLLPALATVDHPARVEVARFLSSNHLLFLNVAMAAAKAVADWAAGVEGASVAVGMARNGTTFGIRLPGAHNRWFTAPAPAVGDALFHPGHGPEDAAPDIGDSSVLELVGLGGAAAAASPAVAAFLGGSMAAAAATTMQMERICVARSSRFKLPYLDFRGSPVGVDIRKVVEHQISPSITTGILHATAGTGQIGAGVVRAPLACFEDALLTFDAALR